ncbi:MAG: hypothetical protein ACOC7R_02015 [Planctomycetota bacterium]
MDAPVTFPTDAIPAEASHAKLLGLHPQRQDGRWMQRVRISAGRVTGPQWRALAAIARELTPGEPLHLTTRQDFEIHGLTAETAPEAQRRMADAGLTGFGGGGDSIRNVTVCPCSGAAPGSPDLQPLATYLTGLLQSHPQAFALPRKFKVSLSACREAEALPWMQDVGLVARSADAGWAFDAAVAGSLGATPALGIAWPRPLAAADVPRFVLAALDLFARHGDRANRRKARLRHVRRRMGDEAFLAALAEQFEATAAPAGADEVPIAAPARPLAARRRVAVPGGNLTPDVVDALADLADRDDLVVRLGIHQGIWVFAAGEATLDEALAPLPASWVGGPIIVTCPGMRWCSRALADTQAMAHRLWEDLGALPVQAFVAISGCPNGCAHSAVADIGLFGGRTGPDDQRDDAFTVVVGGSARQSPRIGTVVERNATADEAIDLVLAHARATADD